MREVSDAFLLNMAEVSSQLVGLFLVGIFFYVEMAFRRTDPAREIVAPYIRASARIVLAIYAIPIGLSLSLVVMEPAWSRALFVILSIILVAANIDSASRVRPVADLFKSPILVATELLGTAAVATLVVLPWVLGGTNPSREDLTWAILLAFATGFLSICAIVLTAFDIARLEVEPERVDERPPRPRQRRRPRMRSDRR